MFNFSNALGNKSGNNIENRCKIAVSENTDYKVLGIYGSGLESEWQPVAVYVLLKEIYKFKVLRREFKHLSPPWQFDFVEMSFGKTVVFVYNLETKFNYCAGPNSFFVKKK